MKVAMISSIFPPVIGGPAKHIYDQAKALREKNIKVFVITFGDNNFYEEVEGIRVYYLKKYFSGIRFSSLVLKYVNAYLRMNRIFKEETPHVVHDFSGGGYLSLISGIVTKKKKIPSIIKFAGDLTWERTVKNLEYLPKYEDISAYNRKARFLKRLQRYILNNFDTVIATSGFQMKSLTDVYQISLKKLVRLPNFINLRDYEKKTQKEKIDRKIQILNVCRFARWKRIDLCVLVFSMLNPKNLELKIVGGGNPQLEKDLKDLCKDLKIEEKVSFEGEVNPIEISRYFKDADIFFSTTAYEPFGIVFIEAMAAGLPIVASRIGGIPDIVRDGTGFLVDPDDTNAMVQKLEQLIENKTLRELMGKRGIEKARNFELTEKIDTILNIYLSLISKHKECSNDLSCTS